MTTVILTVELIIDSNSEEETQHILNKMNYTFNYVKMENDYTGKGMYEKEYIENSEITAINHIGL